MLGLLLDRGRLERLKKLYRETDGEFVGFITYRKARIGVAAIDKDGSLRMKFLEPWEHWKKEGFLFTFSSTGIEMMPYKLTPEALEKV